MVEKLLGKYIIENALKGSEQITLLLRNEDSSAKCKLDFILMGKDIQLNCLASANKADPNFLAQLRFFRNVHNDFFSFLKNQQDWNLYPADALPPYFNIQMIHEGFVTKNFQDDKLLYYSAYQKILASFVEKYSLKLSVEPDFVRKEKAVISLLDNYVVELTRPHDDSPLLKFFVASNQHSDYSRMIELSDLLLESSKKGFGVDLKKSFGYETTQCHFCINVEVPPLFDMTKISGLLRS